MVFPTDVWFLFGTLTYGLEASAVDFDGKSLWVQFHPPQQFSSVDLQKLLADMTSSQKHLVASEIRIFPPLHPRLAYLKSQFEFPLIVKSNSAPMKSADQEQQFVYEFTSLSGAQKHTLQQILGLFQSV